MRGGLRPFRRHAGRYIRKNLRDYAMLFDASRSYDRLSVLAINYASLAWSTRSSCRDIGTYQEEAGAASRSPHKARSHGGKQDIGSG